MTAPTAIIARPPKEVSVRTREARGALLGLHLNGDAIPFMEWVTQWHPAVVLAWVDAYSREANLSAEFVLEQSK